MDDLSNDVAILIFSKLCFIELFSILRFLKTPFTSNKKLFFIVLNEKLPLNLLLKT